MVVGESNKRALDELFEKLRQDVEEDARMMTEQLEYIAQDFK